MKSDGMSTEETYFVKMQEKEPRLRGLTFEQVEEKLDGYLRRANHVRLYEVKMELQKVMKNADDQYTTVTGFRSEPGVNVTTIRRLSYAVEEYSCYPRFKFVFPKGMNALTSTFWAYLVIQLFLWMKTTLSDDLAGW